MQQAWLQLQGWAWLPAWGWPCGLEHRLCLPLGRSGRLLSLHPGQAKLISRALLEM